MIEVNQLQKWDGEQKIVTSCDKCLFRLGDEEQTGCSFGDRIDKLVEHEDINVFTIDNDGRKSCVMNIFCNACTKGVPEGNDPKEYITNVINQQVDLIILTDESTELADVVLTYEYAVSQEICPKKVVVSYTDNEKFSPQTLQMALSQQDLYKEGTTFTIVRSFPDVVKYESEHIYNCINKCRSPFVGFFYAGTPVPYNYCSTVDKLVNIEIQIFVSINSPLGGINGSLVLTNVLKRVLNTQYVEGGNTPEAFDYTAAIKELLKHERSLTWTSVA